MWRELRSVDHIVDLNRSVSNLSVDVTTPEVGNEVWTWDLPSFNLRRRVQQHPGGKRLANGDNVGIDRAGADVRLVGPAGQFPLDVSGGGSPVVMVAGLVFAAVIPGPSDSTITLFSGSASRPVAVVKAPPGALVLSSVGDRITMAHASGTVVSINTDRPTDHVVYRMLV
jgi:hypothetical protein